MKVIFSNLDSEFFFLIFLKMIHVFLSKFLISDKINK